MSNPNEGTCPAVASSDCQLSACAAVVGNLLVLQIDVVE